MTTSDSGFNILSNLETVVSNADQGIVISKLLKHATIIQKIFETNSSFHLEWSTTGKV